jgi:hypothetical protein
MAVGCANGVRMCLGHPDTSPIVDGHGDRLMDLWFSSG